MGLRFGVNHSQLKRYERGKCPHPAYDYLKGMVIRINQINLAALEESLKNRYQQNLTELENLYGALSQKAFKGELDLSRMPLV